MITARMVQREQQERFLEEMLGEDVDSFLLLFSQWRRRLSDQSHADWIQFELSNGGFFLAPSHHEGPPSAEAFGVAVTACALRSLSEEAWGRLRAYAATHPEARAIAEALES